MKKVTAVLLFICVGLGLGACTTNNATEYVHAMIREDVDDMLSDEQVVTGMVKENSIVQLHEQVDRVVIELSIISDYYSLEGDYVQTLVSYSKTSEQKLTGQITNVENHHVVIHAPQTILLPSTIDNPVQKKLSATEIKQLKHHVHATIQRIGEWKEQNEEKAMSK